MGLNRSVSQIIPDDLRWPIWRSDLWRFRRPRFRLFREAMSGPRGAWPALRARPGSRPAGVSKGLLRLQYLAAPGSLQSTRESHRQTNRTSPCSTCLLSGGICWMHLARPLQLSGIPGDASSTAGPMPMNATDRHENVTPSAWVLIWTIYMVKFMMIFALFWSAHSFEPAALVAATTWFWLGPAIVVAASPAAFKYRLYRVRRRRSRLVESEWMMKETGPAPVNR